MRRRSKRLCWGNVYWGYKWTVFYIICPLWCKILALVFPLKLRQEQLSHWTLISECALELQQPPAWVTITFGTLGLASQELSLTSAKLAAAVLVLSGFEIFNIFPFHLFFFPESDGQLNSGAAGPDHPATRRSHVPGPVLRRRLLPCCPWVVNNILAMKQNLAEMQIKLNWMERLDMVNRPAPLAPELALYKDGERYEGGGEQYRAKQAGMPLSFLFHTKRWHWLIALSFLSLNDYLWEGGTNI